MGRCLARRSLQAAVAFVGLGGFLISCSAVSGPAEHGPTALTASAVLEVSENFSAADLQQQFQDIAARTAPAVVAISATEEKVASDESSRSDDINGERLTSMLSSVDRTVGTGFVVDPDGFIVTNDHVIAHAEQLWVTLDDHRVFPAIVVGSDPRGDLAVLKVPATGLPTAQLGDGSRVKRGQWAIAMGNPYGLSGSGEMCASVGIVSAVDRSLPRLSDKEDRLYSGLIQTTAQINPGNSGGPLFDLKGRVIGMNSAVVLPQKQTNGIGFAIPVGPRFQRKIEDLKQGREVVYGYLGVRVATPTPHESHDAGLSDGTGARVESIDDGSPAAARLQTGDIVIRFNDQDVSGGDQFVRLVGEASVGRDIPAVVWRDGATKTVDLHLKPREQAPSTITREKQRLRWRGLLVGPIPANWAVEGHRRSSSGVIVLGIDSTSALQRDGVRQGAIITSVAGRPVTDLSSFQRIVNEVPADKCLLRLLDKQTELVAAD